MPDFGKYVSRLPASTPPELARALSDVFRDLVGESQPIEKKLNLLFLTPQDFGAKADGVNDDTAAIQAAVNHIQSLAAGSTEGRKLYFPHGHYLISDAITIADQMVIQGDGVESTKIQTDAGFIFDISSGDVQVRDLFFMGPTGAGSNGIKLTNGNNCIIERCVFQNQDTGIELNSSFAVEVIGCVFDVCYTYGIYAATACHNLMVERCGFFTCGEQDDGQAIRLTTASDNIGIINNDFEYCNVNVQMANCTAVEIRGNYMEYHDAECLYFTGTNYGVVVENNWIALGGATNGGNTLTMENIVGGTFKFNTIYNQSVSFVSSSLVGFDVGLNRHTGTGTVDPTPWIAPTLLNSWAQQTNYTTVGYIKDSNGWVHLRGAVVSGTAPDVIFTLPSGYRPAAIAVFSTESSNGACRITIETDGDVVPTVAASNNPCLDGISFYVGN